MSSAKSTLVGKPAPDFDATTTDNKIVNASDYWTKKPVILVFLRHLGCTFCRTQVIELARTYSKFQDMGAEVVCVAMGQANVGKAFQIMFNMPFPMLMLGEDNTLAYDKYRLGKGTFSQLLGVASLVNGIKAMTHLKGQTFGGMQGDGRQMPGTFIIDTHGVVQFAYISQNASDNPPISTLLGALSTVTGGIPLNADISQSTSSTK